MALACCAAVFFGCRSGESIVERPLAAAKTEIARSIPEPVTAAALPIMADGDRDGFPDAAELIDEVDRRNFRRWMALIAESLFYGDQARWGEGNRDCAGLARYAVVEALKKHDRQWRSRNNYVPEMAIPDVRRYSYPLVPLLGEKIFRTAAGAYRTGEEFTETFAAFADAENLLLHNVRRLDDTERIDQGDLLFYRNTDNSHYPYHVMVYIGEGSVYTGYRDYVVYHTGPDGDDPGEVRKARLALLKNHPNPKWRPLADNESYLGAFRLKLID